MSALFDLIGAPLDAQTGGGGGGAPNAPTLTVSDNGDGTGAVATIAGSSPGATNTVRVARVVSSTTVSAFSAAGSRSGNGTVAIARAPGNYWAFVHSVLADGSNVSNMVEFAVTASAAASQDAWDDALNVSDAGSTAEQVNSTNLSLPRLRLMDLVAACPTFRAITGETTSSGAMQHVHSPFVEDSIDSDGNVSPSRPRCIINPNEFNRNVLGTSFGGSNGNLVLSFEVLPPPAALGDPNLELTAAEQLFGQIIDEMEARRGQNKDTGEGVMTRPDHSHLNVTKIEVTALGGCYPEEEQGILFYGIVMLIDYQ